MKLTEQVTKYYILRLTPGELNFLRNAATAAKEARKDLQDEYKFLVEFLEVTRV